ncbi:hypothetical protein AVEN_198828-1 [Araneus ventricosus]|uniref:Uncharacterized protein n=1 Tax=Araneus ventricosus TaxID=182803 RepID=A0A4Y2HSK2_ARAVE|nr:hypothetical protein AVEN_198828-1 [Araneus ventricosus]
MAPVNYQCISNNIRSVPSKLNGAQIVNCCLQGEDVLLQNSWPDLSQDFIYTCGEAGATNFALFNLAFSVGSKEKWNYRDAASRRSKLGKRERRVVETEEERSRGLSTMAQRGQDKRAEEAEEQRNSRLSDMAQRG